MLRIAGSFVIAVVLCTMPSFADEPVACSTDWGYGDTNGPNQWGQLNKAYSACDTGPLQAPVKLDSPTVPAPLLRRSSPPASLSPFCEGKGEFDGAVTHLLARSCSPQGGD